MRRSLSGPPCRRLLPVLGLAAALAGCSAVRVDPDPLGEPHSEVRHAEPDFTLSYPASWEHKDLKPGEYLHVAAAKGAPNIIVAQADPDLPRDKDKLARQLLAGFQASQGFHRGDVADVRRLRLPDGRLAREVLITWRHPLYRVSIATLFVLVERGDDALKLVATDLGSDLTASHRAWCYSLRLD